MQKALFTKLATISIIVSQVFFAADGSWAQDASSLVPKQWLYSKNKILTYFYKCTSDTCNKSSLVSYHFQDVTKVTPDQFKAGIGAIASNFRSLGYKLKYIGKAETVPAPAGVHYAIYAQKFALTDPKGKTIQQISGLIVGDKLSISIDSTSGDLAAAQANFSNYASLISSTLSIYEAGLKGKKSSKCIKNKMIPVCFGPT